MILDCHRGEILLFVQDDIQTPVVPNERSDRGALPKGKDLALPLPCHPDGVLFAGRISALNLDCLRGEILHFVQDDKSEVFPLRGCSLRFAWVLRERDRPRTLPRDD